MKFRRTPIPGLLRRFAVAYWEAQTGSEAPPLELSPASALINLLFPLQPMRLWKAGHEVDVPPAFLGQILQPQTHGGIHGPHQHVMGITLSLSGMQLLFGIPPRLALNGIIPYQEATRLPVPAFVYDHRRYPTYAARYAAALDWLAHLARDAEQAPTSREQAIALIAAHQGAVPLQAGLGNLSSRQLERATHELLGIRPKLLARLLRFNHALAHLVQMPHMRVLEVADACGYADAAHLARDFRELCGMVPTQWREDRNLYAQHLKDMYGDVEAPPTGLRSAS